MFLRASMKEHGMIAAAVGAEADAEIFLALLATDFEDLAPSGLAQGLPTSRKLGFVRGQCLPHGRAAAFVKSHPDIVALIRVVCTAFGKLDPWDPAFGGKPCTSFDAVLMSDPERHTSTPMTSSQGIAQKDAAWNEHVQKIGLITQSAFGSRSKIGCLKRK